MRWSTVECVRHDFKSSSQPDACSAYSGRVEYTVEFDDELVAKPKRLRACLEALMAGHSWDDALASSRVRAETNGLGEQVEQAVADDGDVRDRGDAEDADQDVHERAHEETTAASTQELERGAGQPREGDPDERDPRHGWSDRRMRGERDDDEHERDSVRGT